MQSIEETLGEIKSLLVCLIQREQVKEWYTTAEVARIVGKAEFTVREWSRLGRVRAEKRRSGRGAFPSWAISHQELLRFQREGLLPCRGRG